LAKREFRPALSRDLSVALAVLAIAEVLNFGAVVLLLVHIVPRIG